MMDRKKALVLILVLPSGETESTSGIRSKDTNQAYRDNYDLIFGTKKDSAVPKTLN